MSSDTEINSDENHLETLQARLADREQLVEELTSRLEQAAEQLDRLRRSGADRGGRVIQGGLPDELVQQQRELTEELQAAVQQWCDMQPTALLSRVEMQVSELRDLVADGATTRPAVTEFVQPAAQEEIKDAQPPAESAARREPAGSQNSGLSSYEAFKAGLLDGGASEPASPPPAAEFTPDPEPDDATSGGGPAHSAETTSESSESGRESPPEIPVVEPPAPIDLDSATPEELRAAVDSRDSYIVYLNRRLRATETSTRLAGNWSELEGVPDELRSRLEDYEQQLQQSLREAELETSLERARLGRGAQRLELLENQLRKRALQLGIPEEDVGEESGDAGEEQEQTLQKNGRWFRLFGK